VTLPKALAERYGIDPGDDIEWEAAGDVIRVVPVSARASGDTSTRLRLFDQATLRQKRRQQGEPAPAPEGRGWTREELYERRAR
jgi:bifunctional DNA-binding transcriptional regulator/antitoxin component of YhaV-PrlF toxin-antitoxin module